MSTWQSRSRPRTRNWRRRSLYKQRPKRASRYTLSGKLATAQEAYDRVAALTAQHAALDTVLTSLKREIEGAEASRHAVNTKLQEHSRELADLERTIEIRQQVLATVKASLEDFKSQFEKAKSARTSKSD